MQHNYLTHIYLALIADAKELGLTMLVGTFAIVATLGGLIMLGTLNLFCLFASGKSDGVEGP